jgi:hypothetical protein
MKLTIKRLLAFSLFLAAALHFSFANAGEGVFGWIYTLDLQPKGTLEFEQRLQLNQQQAAGKYDAWTARTELEYGLTNDLQVAGYINSYYTSANQNYTNPEACEDAPTCTGGYGVPSSHDPSTPYRRSGIEGGSLEAIYRITNPVTSPVGVGLYLEPSWGRNKDEIEARLLLQSNFIDDRLVVASNIVVANERLKFIENGNVPESMLDILVGASYRFAPKWSAGVEARFHNDYSELTYVTKSSGPHLSDLICTMPLKTGGSQVHGAINSLVAPVWVVAKQSALMPAFGIAIPSMNTSSR